MFWYAAPVAAQLCKATAAPVSLPRAPHGGAQQLCTYSEAVLGCGTVAVEYYGTTAARAERRLRGRKAYAVVALQ